MVHVGATCANANEVERANTAMLARILIAMIRALSDTYVFILKLLCYVVIGSTLLRRAIGTIRDFWGGVNDNENRPFRAIFVGKRKMACILRSSLV